MLRLASLILVFVCCVIGARALARPVAAAASAAPLLQQSAEGERGTDRHLAQLLERYLWIVPTGSGHRASTGAALLVLVTLLLQLSAKMADLEMRSFGRCLCVSGVMGAALVVEASCTPLRPLHLSGIAVGNLALWFVTTRFALSARALPATVTLACFLLTLLSGVLLLEIAGFLTGGHATA